MKTSIAVLVLFILVAAVALGLWTRQIQMAQVTSAVEKKAAPALAAIRPVNAHPMPPNVVKPGEWHEYRQAQVQTLQNNPDLAAEYKAIVAEMGAQEKALEAAMIKADPKVAPIVAKLDAIRARNTVAESSSK